MANDVITKWALDNIEPDSLWLFAAPAVSEPGVALRVTELRWTPRYDGYDVEIEEFYVVGAGGEAQESLPHGAAGLPGWFKEFQSQQEHTLYHMVAATFRELVEEGRLRPYELPAS